MAQDTESNHAFDYVMDGNPATFVKKINGGRRELVPTMAKQVTLGTRIFEALSAA